MNSVDTTTQVAISPARLNWVDGVPESRDFGDVYFSRDNGLEETRYVFLGHNHLDERFRAIEQGGHFVIAESGFGTGLNFLATWQCWRNAAPPTGAVLHFVSVEKFPLTPEDLHRAHQLWPELAELAGQLQAAYPELTAGVHRIVLDGGRVRLTLFFGDALDGWKDLEFTADAWFLDGFAPSLNPELWVDDVVDAVSQHSRPGTTIATFTAVGRIRRALIASGFEMAKVPGYGRKREMLTGTYEPREPHRPDKDLTDTGPAGIQPSRSVVIVGAGMAGSLLARNLAERGLRVTVVDSGTAPGHGASGNQQGALYVKLGVDYSPQTQLALSALLYAQRFYPSREGSAWFPTGVLQIAYSDAEQRRQSKFLASNNYPPSIVCPVTPNEASDLAGIPIKQSGLWFAQSGWLKPPVLCNQMLEHPGITTRFGFDVADKFHMNGRWRITSRQGETVDADTLVLCAGHRVTELLPEGQYRFKPIRGQVTLLDQTAIQPPACVICGNRYLNPADNDLCLTGASFDLRDSNPELTTASHQENLEELARMLPGIFTKTGVATESLGGRVGFRCTTHDYQPVVGPLDIEDAEDTNEATKAYLLTGFGSKGLTYGPLLAEYLADVISGQPRALPISMSQRLRAERCRNQS